MTREHPSEDLWERHAGWWQDQCTDGADPEYAELIVPLAAELLAGYDRVLDVGAGEGQLSRLADELGASLVVGVDPTKAQLSKAAQRAGGPAYVRASAEALPLASGAFDAAVACLVFEHIEAMDTAVAEAARMLRDGGRFLLFLNHPLLQTPDSGWIDDHILDPPEQYWRIGAYLARERDDRGGAKGRVPAVRTPPAEPLCERLARCGTDDRPNAGTGTTAGISGRRP